MQSTALWLGRLGRRVIAPPAGCRVVATEVMQRTQMLRSGWMKCGACVGSTASDALTCLALPPLTAMSDLDFVVELQQEALAAYADSGLSEGLEKLFEKHVDLVVESAIKKSYFLQPVEDTRSSVMRSEARK